MKEALRDEAHGGVGALLRIAGVGALMRMAGVGAIRCGIEAYCGGRRAKVYGGGAESDRQA